MHLGNHKHKCDINKAIYKLIDKVELDHPMMLVCDDGNLVVKKVTERNYRSHSRAMDIIGVYDRRITFNEVMEDVNAYFSEL